MLLIMIMFFFSFFFFFFFFFFLYIYCLTLSCIHWTSLEHPSLLLYYDYTRRDIICCIIKCFVETRNRLNIHKRLAQYTCKVFISLRTACMRQLYRMYNSAANSLRDLKVSRTSNISPCKYTWPDNVFHDFFTDLQFICILNYF